ncbi:MAG: hypothetical protein IKP58_06970 [Victivallales bacterium]|nr:hypothetical protein [Victivallales bacterium]
MWICEKKSHKEEAENGRHRNLADKATINAFAHKWHAKVLARSRDIEQPAFADECTALGFEMDCGESFSKAFPDIDFRDVDGFEKVVVGIDDIFLLGTAIFSYWRWFTHWNEFHDICGDEPSKWFLSAFDRLIEMTNEK